MRKTPITFALMGACGLVFPSGFVQAEHESSLQVQTKEKAFTIGHLTLPSQKNRENCTRCATGQNETVFIPQQVNDEPGLPILLCSNEKPMMEQHLYAYNKLFKEKTCMVIN